jgi:hypothetical protein
MMMMMIMMMTMMKKKKKMMMVMMMISGASSDGTERGLRAALGVPQGLRITLLEDSHMALR